MTFDTFKKVVSLTQKCNQSLLYLHNFGEVLLYPDLAEFISYARENGIECSFYTNGLLFTEELLKKLYSAGLRRVSISNHVADTDIKVNELIQKSGVPIFIEEVYDVKERHNWAGQIPDSECDHICHASENQCIFQRQNAFVILWNGDVSSCCIDCEGVSCRFTVDDLLVKDYVFIKSKLCNSCDLMRGEEEL